MRRLSLVFLVALLAAAACGGTSPTAAAPSSTDPNFTAIIRLSFDTLYPAATTRLAITVHFNVDSGNADPSVVPRPDETFGSVVNGTCANITSGNNSTGGRYSFVITVTPTNRQDSVPVGPVYRLILHPFPDQIPYPAPWGLDPNHLLLWKLKVTDASALAPTELPLQLDTISTSRLFSSAFRDTGCQDILP